MAVAEITKGWTFDAAHKLPHHLGKCGNLHGHTYTFRVCVKGEIKPLNGDSDEGMVQDYYDISQVWKKHIEPIVDHKYLNESLAGQVEVTTSESMAVWLINVFHEHGIDLYWAEVSETPTSTARVYPEGW